MSARVVASAVVAPQRCCRAAAAYVACTNAWKYMVVANISCAWRASGGAKSAYHGPASTRKKVLSIFLHAVVLFDIFLYYTGYFLALYLPFILQTCFSFAKIPQLQPLFSSLSRGLPFFFSPLSCVPALPCRVALQPAIDQCTSQPCHAMRWLA